MVELFIPPLLHMCSRRGAYLIKNRGSFALPDIVTMTKSMSIVLPELVANIGEKIKAYEILMGQPEGEGTLGKPRRNLEDNIKMHFKDDEDWVYLVQGSCEHGNEFYI
jgi:hypothetical protein